MIETSSDADVVGVYDAQFRKVFASSRYMKSSVMEGAKVMEQPLEDGSVIAEHRIILPVEAELMVYLLPADFRNAYQQIKEAFLAGTLFSLKTRVTMHSNMLISRMPREETAEDADLIKLLVSFKETKFQKAQFQALPPRKVKSKNDASTVKRGDQSGKSNGSTAYRTIFQ